jgi:hypothetical protein
VHARRAHFDFTGGKIPIARLLRAKRNLTLDHDDGFGTQRRRLCRNVGRGIRVDRHLDDAGAVPKVEEEQATEVPRPMNPSAKTDTLADVGGP